MQSVAVSGVARENLGKRGAKMVRREGLVPAVLYSVGEEPVHFTVKALDLRELVYSPEFRLAELNVGGKTYKAIVKDYQFHPVTDEMMHIDFLALKDGHPVKVQVPVRFEGTSPGVRNGGKLQVAVRRVKVKATPENLIDHVTLDISEMTLGSAIRVRDIQASEGVEIQNPPGQPIASVEVPRALRSAATLAAKEGEADGADADGEEGESEDA